MIPGMYICLCKAVSDRRIRRAVNEGACSLRDLTRDLGLGTVCGKCVPTAREVLQECLDAQPVAKLADLPLAPALPAFMPAAERA
jgi:bacterioferritin-associated ferredoxin